MHVGRNLYHGVDAWLNTPRRPLEACGTSGMKVVLNGGLHASILDGWWAEAWDGENGFAIGNGETPVDLNAAEIDALREADVDGVRLLEALAPRTDDPRALFLPGGDPVLARPLTPVDLEV